MITKQTMRSCICVKGVYFPSFPTIFRLDFGTVLEICYFFFILHCRICWIYFHFNNLLTYTFLEVCQLPSPLQSSSWNYTDNSRELILAFGTSTMSGFKYRFRGEDIESYDCISNTSNVYVFK